MEFNYHLQPGLYRRPYKSLDQDSPLVSIVTAFYNGEKYFSQTCQCVLNQSFPYFEWIVVDDGSTDEESLQILNKLEQEDQRIRVLHKKNEGLAAARNFGIKHASTDYIYILDDDDLIEPTSLEYCWWMLMNNESASWSYTGSCGFGEQEYQWDVSFDPEVQKSQNLLSATALIRKKALLQVGLYYSDGPKHFNEDWHLWLRMLAQGMFPVQSRQEALFWYRRKKDGVLSIVENQTDNINRKLIEEAAANIICPRPPIIYPQKKSVNWHHPRTSNWERVLPQEDGCTSILFLFPWLEMGGADKFNLDLIKGLDKEKYHIGIITTETAQNAWIQLFRREVSDVFNLCNFMNEQDYAEFISYYIKSRNVKLLFVSNSYHGYGLLPWLREQFPNLVIIDYVHMEEWYWRNGGYARISGSMKQITEKTYVCNSGTYNVLKDHFTRNTKSLHISYIGVDEKHFCQGNVRSGILYDELGIHKSRPVILFICRIHPQKRPFLMLEVAKKVKVECPNVAFAVIGDGPQLDELKTAVHAQGLEGTVYFTGAKKEVRPYYKDAKITLITSLKEGLSLTAYESCSMGIPVVTADVGGQKDLVDDKVGALIKCRQAEATDYDNRYFDSLEVNDYVRAIVKILKDDALWYTLSQNCRHRIETNFTISGMVRYFDTEFQHLLADPQLAEIREEKSKALQSLSPLAAEYAMMEFQEYAIERDYGYPTEFQELPYSYEANLQSGGLIRQLNSHEEIVTRHEKSINHHWEIQKWHEERLQALERNQYSIKYNLKMLLKSIYRKLFHKG